MDKLLFYPELTVAETFKKDARVFKVFIQNKTACVGCDLSRFCQLKEAAVTYNIELDVFIDQLQQAVRTNLIQSNKELWNEKTA